MATAVMEIVEFFNMLESDNTENAKAMKAKFAEMFNNTKETWLVNGLIDYYNHTGSMKAVDILIKVPAPHDKYLFDKLGEGLKGSSRFKSLDLLGHVVRRQPLWLYKITKHPIFKELLLLLKTEKEIVPLMSGLLVLVTLLPMIPTLISPFFQEIFDVFGHVASCEDYRGERMDGYKEHLQLGLYGLFHNLYGMYPCNFMDYLKREFSKTENMEVFTHTVRPMLETAKVHPLLIVASKNGETDNSRWKKMEHHDVLIECRRYSSEGTRKQKELDETCFRSRCGTDVSSLLGSASSQLQSSKSSNSTPNLTETQTLTKTTITTMPWDPPPGPPISIKCDNLELGYDSWFSLSEACGASTTPSAPQTPLPLSTYQDTPISYTPISQLPSSMKQHDSGSPPEAAIEATPENTPIKDTRQRFNFPNNSQVVRALGSRLTQPQSHQQFHPHLTSSHSQPPSPLKKEPSPFSRMSSVEGSSSVEPQESRKEAFYTQHRLSRVLQDRSQQTTDGSSSASPHKQISASPLKKLSLKDASGLGGFVPSVPNSPVPLGAAAPISGSTDWPLAKPKPQKDGLPFEIGTVKDNISNLLPSTVDNMKEDREIMELSKRGEVMRSTSIVRDAHIIFAESDSKNRGGSRPQQDVDKDEDGDEHWVEDDATCEGEDRLCRNRKHGLHMPNSSSMLDLPAWTRRVTRTRFYSQCIVEAATTIVKSGKEGITFDKLKINIVRKARSCPDIRNITLLEKVSPNYKNGKTFNKDLLDIQAAVAFENGNITSLDRKTSLKTSETQTIDIWPIGYEYMFNDILQNLYDHGLRNGDIAAIDDKNLSPVFSPYSQVDRYIEILSQRTHELSGKGTQREEIDHLKQQLQLLQLELLYERHRREVHAFRNRRLLGRSRKNRAAEEQNNALKQQLSYLQSEVEDFKLQLSRKIQNLHLMDQKLIDNNKYWQHQVYLRECEIKTERQEKERLATQLQEQQNFSNETSADVQHLHAALFDVSQQLTRAVRKSEMCDRLMDCIKRLQRELVMYGEKDARYGCLNMLPTKADSLITKITQQYKDQIIHAQSLVQAQTTKMEYLQARESDLEQCVANKEQINQELKKQLRLVKEEYSERLKAVEEKYLSVKRINQRMEAHCLELLQRIPQSPQTISRDLTSGFSPQSSPLSASLASSEGHGPMLASRVDEIRNLQVIVNAHETIDESTSNSVNNTLVEDDNH